VRPPRPPPATRRASAERILAEFVPDAAGTARLSLLGLVTTVLAFQSDPEPLTLARLRAITGLAERRLHRDLETLRKAGLVAPAPNGRPGDPSRPIALARTPQTRRLLAAPLQAATASAEKRRRSRA
jgi:hypothetical protein